MVEKVESFYIKRVNDGATAAAFFTWAERHEFGQRLGIPLADDEVEPEDEADEVYDAAALQNPRRISLLWLRCH